MVKSFENSMMNSKKYINKNLGDDWGKSNRLRVIKKVSCKTL